MLKNLGRVAIVADQMTAFGGADREMLSVLKLIPNADIYTVLYNPNGYSNVKFKNKINSTFVQKLPFRFHLSRHLKVLNPIAYESLDLRNYDTLISISAGPARGIIPGIDQIHIAMILTPPRSLWDMELNVRGSLFKSIYRPLSQILNNYYRIWDRSLVNRVDYWIANSKFIAQKTAKRYGVKAEVIYPGIGEQSFENISKKYIQKVLVKYDLPEEFFLSVSRLYDHKRVDWAIKSSIETGSNLVIVGRGPDEKYLKKLSKGYTNIYFLGFLEKDKEVRALYKQAHALLFCGIEDFGLVPVEAMAQGTPILAYNKGGVTETVLPEVTGEFFDTESELTYILNQFDKRGYNPSEITKRASTFTEEIFLENLNNYFEKIYEK